MLFTKIQTSLQSHNKFLIRKKHFEKFNGLNYDEILSQKNN